MLSQALVRPGRAGFKVVIVRVESDKINRQFTTDNQLFQISLLCRLGGVGFLDSQRDRVRANVTEVQIGGQAAGAIALWLVAIDRIICQIIPDKTLQPLERLICSAGDAPDRRNRAVELPSLCDVNIGCQRSQAARRTSSG